MNKARRKAIREIGDQLEILYERLEQISDEERDYFDTMPGNLQSSERGKVAEEAASRLDSESFFLGKVAIDMLRNWQ